MKFAVGLLSLLLTSQAFANTADCVLAITDASGVLMHQSVPMLGNQEIRLSSEALTVTVEPKASGEFELSVINDKLDILGTFEGVTSHFLTLIPLGKGVRSHQLMFACGSALIAHGGIGR